MTAIATITHWQIVPSHTGFSLRCIFANLPKSAYSGMEKAAQPLKRENQPSFIIPSTRTHSIIKVQAPDPMEAFGDIDQMQRPQIQGKKSRSRNPAAPSSFYQNTAAQCPPFSLV